MKVHENLSIFVESDTKPDFLVVCQVGEAIRLVEVSGPEEMPLVRQWLKDAAQWQVTKLLSLYQLAEEKESSGATNSTETPKRRGRPPRSESAPPVSAAGVVAGGVDPGPLEDEQS